MQDKAQRKAAIQELLTDYLLAKLEAEARLPVVQRSIDSFSDPEKDGQRKMGPELRLKTLEFLLDKKAQIQKGIIAIENNMEFYRGKLK